MPVTSSALLTTKSQQSASTLPETKVASNDLLSHTSSKKKITMPIVFATSKKSVDAASKTNNNLSNEKNHLNNKSTRHFHDSKLDLSKPGKKQLPCSRSNSTSSNSSCDSSNISDNTDHSDNISSSSSTNSLHSLNGIENMLDDYDILNLCTDKNVDNFSFPIISNTNNEVEILNTTIDIPQSSQQPTTKSDKFSNK
ncbi:1944_t:CDS:2, partial [Scutellospora calospora]